MTMGLKLFRALEGLFYLIAGISALFFIGVLVLFFIESKNLPRIPEPLSRINQTPPTEILSSDGQTLLVAGGKKTTPLDTVSFSFIQAILATEDHRFWNHHGVDKLRTMKALWVTLFEPGKIQGASTVTQQLAKNLFFSFEKTFRRKFRELLAAWQIEARFDKKEILEAYINQIPFGPSAYGIGDAALFFFNKSPSELTLAESALLAGLPKSPTRYNPYRHLERAKKRQRIVLGRMVATGAITQKEADAAFEKSLDFIPSETRSASGGYFLDMVLKTLEEKYGPDVVFHGGLKVTTTLDYQLQNFAENALEKGLGGIEDMLGPEKGQPGNLLQGAVAAVEVDSGAVRALVGGRNYSSSPFNRAANSRRQPGSGFKPFLYYAAFEKLGISPGDIITDRPVKIKIPGAGTWRPKNFGHQHKGRMVIKSAFTTSVNTVAAQLVEKVGPEAVVEIANRCGITSPLSPVYSVALGTSGVSPLEMAASYATFATGGIQHDAYVISRVEDSRGRVLEEYIPAGKRVLDKNIAYQVLDMMAGVVDGGTGKIVRRMGLEIPAAGKTGTTNAYRDAWFTGFTPTLSTAVWVGFDKKIGIVDKNGAGVTGGRAAAPIWTRFMLAATEGEPARAFLIPPGIRFDEVRPHPWSMGIFSENEPVRVTVISDGNE